MYIYIYMCVYLHICICVYTYLYTYAHTLHAFREPCAEGAAAETRNALFQICRGRAIINSLGLAHLVLT